MRTGKPSRTADQNALFRTLESLRPAPVRVADDRLAARFLSPEFRLLAGAARLAPARRLLETVIDSRWPCARPGVVARTRLIDELVAPELGRVDQVLILGAGFDSRAFRLAGRGFELVSDERVADAARRFYPPGRCPAAPAYYHVAESRRR
jgi:O-methyltransferase involved in polyketide biosynthesis